MGKKLWGRPHTLAPQRVGWSRTGILEEGGYSGLSLYRKRGNLPRFFRYRGGGEFRFLCDQHKIWRVTRGNVFPIQPRGHVLITRFKPGHKVLVVDAGGGTVDVSSYTVKSTSPLEVEEFHEPKCNGLISEFNPLD